MALTTVSLEDLDARDDYCPVCRVSGMQPCVADDGFTEVPDHTERPKTFAASGGE